MAIKIPDATGLNAAKRRDWERAWESYFSERAVLSEMFTGYVQGVGIFDDWTLFGIRHKINEAAVLAGLIGQSGSVFDSNNCLKAEYLEAVCSRLRGCYYDVVPAGVVTDHVLLAQSVNENCNIALPPKINMVAKKHTRPEVRLYSASGCQVYLHPFCYQVYWSGENWFCPSASNRSLSRVALRNQLQAVETQETSRDIVIVQDRFAGTNFSHFLFDWVTRIGLVCDSGLVEPRNCLFALGGAPGRFQQMVLEAVSAEFGLSEDQLFFPSEGILLQSTGRVLWFSDQMESYLHPAQIAHPQSVKILRRIATRLCPTIDGRFGRIYISRMDADRRRVSNEADIVHALGKLNFEPVALGDFPVDQQLQLVAGAYHIIAPHGMGLTYVSLHPGTPTLIELHNPTAGTDAYALLAKAMGFAYQSIVGQPSSGNLDDFTIPMDELMSAAERLGPSAGDTVFSFQLANLPQRPPGKFKRPGFTSEPTFMPASPLNPASEVSCHIRTDPQITPDTNVAAWNDIRVDEGRLYTASCWIWVPQGFQGSNIELSLGEWSKQFRRIADLNVRDRWQLITASKTSPSGIQRCSVVLRVNSPKGEYVFSTDWQLEIGVGRQNVFAV